MLCVAPMSAKKVTLGNGDVSLTWKSGSNGWRLVEVKAEGEKLPLSGEHNVVLYSESRPSAEAVAPAEYGGETGFPEPQYRYVLPSWREATTEAALNRAGELIGYLPSEVIKTGDGEVIATYESTDFAVEQKWTLSGSDVNVTMTLTARRGGWYSAATPPVTAVAREDVDFALIPGVLHGHVINEDFSRAYAYGWGIPALPVLYRERSASTMTSMLSSTQGVTVAVTAAPGTATGPWMGDRRNKDAWRLGLSAMNRQGELSPTLYHPVIGEDGSYMKAGDAMTFSFTYSFGKSGWWPVFDHVARDIYRFKDGLDLRSNRRSLTDRLQAIHRYLVNDSTSKWHTVVFEGDTIGAQEYLGGVYKAQKDAMKNADYGAMWMLGAVTGDTLITARRLQYALNFKLRQQNAIPGLLHGASRGQYYLQKGEEFVEEWGPYTEPIATTYYMLMDLGNISLFEPDNQEVRDAIEAAANCLLRLQKADGSWEVAYDADLGAAFTDLKDYRPTFYGLLIAYRITGDVKYLDGALRGADWLIANAVDPDRWLGVCGDTRFAPDFATVQAAQALLELADATGEERYKNAAIRIARAYTTSVYTNPVASADSVTVKGRRLADWQISQAGLSYEHGGVIGSTNLHGPILLASHAGLFVRMADITGDSLFLDMARAAAIGRDAHVDEATGVASYYWDAMNRGAGPYPHHAWWQMGWITDYLMAELEHRSNGAISFPAGFITPKVGPHRTYGFAAGEVNGEKADLIMRQGAFSCDNPNVEVVMAQGEDKTFYMLLNDVDSEQEAVITIHGVKHHVRLEPYGLEVLSI